MLKSVGVLQNFLGFVTGASEEIVNVTIVHVTEPVVRMDVKRDVIDYYTKIKLRSLSTTATKRIVIAYKPLHA